MRARWKTCPQFRDAISRILMGGSLRDRWINIFAALGQIWDFWFDNE